MGNQSASSCSSERPWLSWPCSGLAHKRACDLKGGVLILRGGYEGWKYLASFPFSTRKVPFLPASL